MEVVEGRVVEGKVHWPVVDGEGKEGWRGKEEASSLSLRGARTPVPSKQARSSMKDTGHKRTRTQHCPPCGLAAFQGMTHGMALALCLRSE